MMLGAIVYNGATGAGTQSGTCNLYAYCKAVTDKGTTEVIAGAGSSGKKTSSAYVTYDTPDQIQAKVREVSGMNCLYVDNIDLDDAKCRCQKQEQFPLLSRVKKGLSARSASVHR
ncbi:hypothetical protein MTO96_043613 [Rhipicephalus appendiculatus]